MKTIRLVLLVLGFIAASFSFFITTSQEMSSAFTPIYCGDDLLLNVRWSSDSQRLVFQQRMSLKGEQGMTSEFDQGVISLENNNWYIYPVGATGKGQLIQAHNWPLQALETDQVRNLPIATTDTQRSFVFTSPDGRYAVYAADAERAGFGSNYSGYPLALTDTMLNETAFFEEVNIAYGLKNLENYEVEWSADSSAFTVKIEPAFPGATLFYVSGFADGINQARLHRLSNNDGFEIDGEIVALQTELGALSANGERLLLKGTVSEDREFEGQYWLNTWLYDWSVANPIESRQIVRDNTIRAATFAVDQRGILFIGQNGLTYFDLKTDELAVRNPEVKSSWVDRAWFSPDASHVALLDQDVACLYVLETY